MIYVDPIYRCVKRMLGMITIGVDVIILYIVFTIFFAAFNRLILFDQKGEENSDSFGLHGWENSSTSTFNYAVLVIWNLSPGSNVPDYALKHATVNGYLSTILWTRMHQNFPQRVKSRL